MREELELFAKNLNVYMKYYELTQAQLAEKLGCDHTTVSTWCMGKRFPRYGVLEKMADVFNCRMSDLLERETSPETIESTAQYVRLTKYVDMLTQEGVNKVLTYLEDLNPKFFKDDAVSK